MSDNLHFAETVAEDLRGTCQSLTVVLHKYNLPDDDILLLEAVDQIVFECDECGWWCEISEMAETDNESEQVCDDCAN